MAALMRSTASRRGRGRPALVEGRGRGARQLKATVTDDEHARVMAHIEATGVTVSALIREGLSPVLDGTWSGHLTVK